MQIMYDFSQFLQRAVTDICRTGSWDNYEKAIKSKKSCWQKTYSIFCQQL